MAGPKVATRVHARTVPLEKDIQRAIVSYCARVLIPPCKVVAIPNAAPRGKSGRASNAVAGLTKGVPDLLVVLPNRVIFAEVKSGPRAKVSPEQRQFLMEAISLGHASFIWTSIDDVRASFAALDVVTREAA